MAERLNELYSELFARVIEDDERTQRYYLSMVEEHRHISVDYLLQRGALFIPNNDYIKHYLGDRATRSNVGLYYDGKCPWMLFVVLPIQNLAGETVGLVGWDAYNKYLELEEGAQGLVSYQVSHKSVFQRDKYFLADVDCLRSTFDKRVIFITDGVFDSVSLSYRGIPAIALLGSSFSREIIYFLSWYNHIYVCADNDNAGLSLARKVSRACSGVHRIIQSKSKDIEELLRGDGVDGPITKQLLGLMSNPIPADVVLKV